jgi:hypothetical protein
MKKSVLVVSGFMNSALGDVIAPTVAITSTESNGTFENPIPLTFTLSEIATDFAVGDITVGAGGSVGNFAGSGTSYTADLTVTSAGATITVDVAGDAFHDGAGNGNTAATQFSITSGLLLKDEFTTDDDAPMTTPRTAEPGPGTMTVIDTGNQLSTMAGKLHAASATGTGDPRAYGSVKVRAAGLAGISKVTTNSAIIWGWHSATSAYPQKGAFQKNGTTLQLIPGSAVGVVAANTDYETAIVLRSAGAFFLIKGGAFTDWTLLYVNKILTDANVYHGFAAVAGTMDVYYDIEANLGAPWNSDYGIATARTASAGVGDTITSTADAVIESTWTAVTGETYELSVRRTDDDNRWIIRGSQGDSTIKLIKVEAASESEVGTAACAFTNGLAARFIVVTAGDTIAVYTDDSYRYIYYASATFNNTATGVKTSHAAANLTAYPRTISGAALTELIRPL